MNIVYYAAFCTIMPISQQKEARGRDYVLFLTNDFARSVHSTVGIDSPAHSTLLDCSKHCICTTPMTAIVAGHTGKKVKVQAYSLISSLKTYHPTLHLTPWSLDLFIRVPFQLHGEPHWKCESCGQACTVFIQTR